MEQPAPGNSGNQVSGLFQVQVCCSPVTTTDHPSPPPFVSYVYYPPLLCHTPFHYISEVSTATSTNQHNHHNIDVGWSMEEEKVCMWCASMHAYKIEKERESACVCERDVCMLSTSACVFVAYECRADTRTCALRAYYWLYNYVYVYLF